MCWLLGPLTCEMILMFKLPSWIAVYDTPYWDPDSTLFHHECQCRHARVKCEKPGKVWGGGVGPALRKTLPGTQCLHRSFLVCTHHFPNTSCATSALCPSSVNLTVVRDVCQDGNKTPEDRKTALTGTRNSGRRAELATSLASSWKPGFN